MRASAGNRRRFLLKVCADNVFLVSNGRRNLVGYKKR